MWTHLLILLQLITRQERVRVFEVNVVYHLQHQDREKKQTMGKENGLLIDDWCVSSTFVVVFEMKTNSTELVHITSSRRRASTNLLSNKSVLLMIHRNICNGEDDHACNHTWEFFEWYTRFANDIDHSTSFIWSVTNHWMAMFFFIAPLLLLWTISINRILNGLPFWSLAHHQSHHCK